MPGTTCARGSTTFAPATWYLSTFRASTSRSTSRLTCQDAERCRDIVLDVLAALGACTLADLLHRDVTPTNVIITPEGRAKLIDFGVSDDRRTTTVVGTPAFMAPEVRGGRGADARSDLYEFAVTMIYVMLGRFPYMGDPDRGDDDRSVLVRPTADERLTWGPLGSAMLDVLFTLLPADPEGAARRPNELTSELKLLQEIPIPGRCRYQSRGGQPSRPLPRQWRRQRGNRGLDDQFARDTYVPTLLDTELLPAIVRGTCAWSCSPVTQATARHPSLCRSATDCMPSAHS